jgi:hypothetical protein
MVSGERQPESMGLLPSQVLKQNPSQDLQKLINNNISNIYGIFQFIPPFKSDKILTK